MRFTTSLQNMIGARMIQNWMSALNR